MGTNKYDSLQTYAVSSVAQSWFSDAAFAPSIPISPIFTNGVDYTSFYIGYESQVSSQTSTWNQRIVRTDINDDMFAWLTKQPAVLSEVPQIMSCSPVSAAGAPLLHIRVSFLTTSSAVTSTTNAMYFNSAATTSAAPASQTPAVISSTKASITDMPSPSTADVSSGKSSNQPTQPAVSQEPGTSSVLPSKQPDDHSPTTNQVGGASSDRTSSPIAADVPTNKPSQELAQPTITPAGIASSVAPSNSPSEKPTQQPAANQGSDTPSVVPSGNPVDQPALPTVNQAGASSAVPSKEDVSEVNSEVVIVIGGVTATALSSSITPAQSRIPDTGAHEVVVPDNSPLSQASTVASQGQNIANGQTLKGSTVPIPTVPAAPVVDSSFGPVSSGAYAIAGQTLNPGGPAIEISGTTYSLRSSGGVVVNGNTVAISTVEPQTFLPSSPIVIGEITATPIASDAYVIADQTLSRRGSAVEVSGITYSLPPFASNAIVNGQAIPISTIQHSPELPATVVIGGVTAKPESSGAYYLVASQTLSPEGSALEVSGVTYSLPTSGANILINGATSIAPTDIRTVSAVMFGSATAVPLLAGGYLVGSQVISPGGSAVTISGHVYSLPTSGSSVVVDGKTTAIQAIAADDDLITVGSQIYTAAPASVTPLVIASQTLFPGGSDITVSGTVFSLPPDSTGNIVVNGQTTALATAAPGENLGLSIGSQQLFLTPMNSGIVIASQTLYPGGHAITVKGETLSIPLHGTAVVIQSGATAITEGLGGYIWQGIASSSSNSGSDTASGTELISNTAVVLVTSSRAGVTSTHSAATTGTEGASSAQTSTSGADGNQPASSYKSATIALVVCLFVVVLW
jgi:hypothetical protein